MKKTRIKILTSSQEGFEDLEHMVNSFLEENESSIDVVQITLNTDPVSTEKCAMVVYNKKLCC